MCERLLCECGELYGSSTGDVNDDASDKLVAWGAHSDGRTLKSGSGIGSKEYGEESESF